MTEAAARATPSVALVRAMRPHQWVKNLLVFVPILLDHRLYMASPAHTLSLLRTVRENAETVMIVGHNPGLEELVAQLTGELQDLPTAALAQIGLPIDHWRDLKLSTREMLVDLWRPEELT